MAKLDREFRDIQSRPPWYALVKDEEEHSRVDFWKAAVHD